MLVSTPAPAHEATPATPSADAAPSSPGLDPELLLLARDAHGVDKVKLRVDKNGQLVKQSVYHADRTRIPAAVLALAGKYEDGMIAFYETERYQDGQRVFEVEIAPRKGPACELAALEDGTQLYTECKLARKEIPPAVSAAAKKLVPGAKTVEAEKKETADGNVTYSLEVESKGRVHEIKMTEAGEVTHHYVRVPAFVDVELP